MRRLLTTLSAIALAITAYAAPVLADNVCNSGEFCVWSDTGFSGSDFWDPSTDDPDWNLFGIENDDDSVKNREAVRVNVYRGNNYSEGVAYCVEPGVQEDDISDNRDNDGDSNLTFDSTGSTDCGTLPAP